MKKLILAFLLAGCGGGSDTTHDMSTLTNQACNKDSDCSDGRCVYKVSDGCSASGVCMTPPTGPTCGAVEILCGCDGSDVSSGCGFPAGYASGPSTGASSIDCGDLH
jgi:hypothetical protein